MKARKKTISKKTERLRVKNEKRMRKNIEGQRVKARKSSGRRVQCEGTYTLRKEDMIGRLWGSGNKAVRLVDICSAFGSLHEKLNATVRSPAGKKAVRREPATFNKACAHRSHRGIIEARC